MGFGSTLFDRQISDNIGNMCPSVLFGKSFATGGSSKLSMVTKQFKAVCTQVVVVFSSESNVSFPGQVGCSSPFVWS